jgi:hypothetical protein
LLTPFLPLKSATTLEALTFSGTVKTIDYQEGQGPLVS